jgi:transposase
MPGTNRKHEVHLTADQRAALEAIGRQQNAPAAKARRARILLLADDDHPDGRRPDWHIAEVVGLSERQVIRIRRRFAADGLDPAVDRKARRPSDTPPKLDGAAEARLIALSCSTPPDGRRRWTLQLLVDELCRLQVVTTVCRETVRMCLKKTGSSPGGPSGSASRRRTGPGSSPRWSRSSTRTTPRTTTSTH